MRHYSRADHFHHIATPLQYTIISVPTYEFKIVVVCVSTTFFNVPLFIFLSPDH